VLQDPAPCLSPVFGQKNLSRKSNAIKDPFNVEFGKGLILGHININGIKSKFDEVRELLLRYNFLFLGITETRLEAEDTFTPFSIPNYAVSRLDRVRNGGGIMFFIRESVAFELISTEIVFPQDTELAVVKVSPIGIKPIIVVIIYNNPKSSNSRFIAAFTSLLSYIDSLNIEYVCMGDFNLDLLSSSAEVSSIVSLRREFGLKQLVREPTRRVTTVRGSTSTLLDHLYVSRPECYPTSGQFPFAGSDHDFIFATRKVNRIKAPPSFISVRSYLKVDWNQVLIKFNELDFNYLSSSCPDIGFITFQRQCVALLDSFAPFKTKMIKGFRFPWFNSEIINLIRRRDESVREKDKCLTLKASKNFRRARNRVNYAVTFAKIKYMGERFVDSFKNRNVWDVVNRLTGRGKKKNAKVCSIINDQGIEVTSDSEIFAGFADSFIVRADDPPDPSLLQDISDYCSTALPENQPEDFDITSREVKGAISKLKWNSSCGKDAIPTKFIKNLSCVFNAPLVLLFNRIMSLCVIPKAFRSSLVTPLYKGSGPRKSSNSYRPISVLNPITKIFEFILFDRLRLIIEPLLCIQQHGFRKWFSCHTALLCFTQQVYKALDLRNGRVGAVFVDLRKAFNSVNHPILLKKLIELNVNPHYVKLLRSYLKDRSFTIKNGDLISDPFDEDGAVPQGSTLGPLLFSAFINDVGRALDLPFFLYADDLVFYSAGCDPEAIVKSLTLNLERLNQWCIDNKLSINISKTEFMWFHKSHDTKYGLVPKVLLNGIEIIRVWKFKYLGLVLDPNLTFKLHLSKVQAKVSSCLGCLYGIRKFVPQKVNQILINAYVLSAYDYCIDIWAVQSRLELSALQNKINRYLYSSIYKPLFRKMTRKLRKSTRLSRKMNYFNANQLDMSDLLLKFKFLTIEERALWTRGKNVLSYLKSPVTEFNSFFKLSSNPHSSRSMPLLEVEGCNSETFRKSVKFKSCKFWNSLPKDMTLYSDTELDGFVKLSEFKDVLYDYLVESRKSLFLSW
jgi:exonuclease III